MTSTRDSAACSGARCSSDVFAAFLDIAVAACLPLARLAKRGRGSTLQPGEGEHPTPFSGSPPELQKVPNVALRRGG
jgi:hypothetical protein